VIDGLLRQGETMNIIAPPKLGKSWLVTDLAIAVATGRSWLETYQTHQGNVLLLDNELHTETSAKRIPEVAAARGVRVLDIAQTVFVDNLRGRLLDFQTLRGYFDGIQPGFFKIIVMEAFYRFLPNDTDENSNGKLTDIYNLIDAYRHHGRTALVQYRAEGTQSSQGWGAGPTAQASDRQAKRRAASCQPHQLPSFPIPLERSPSLAKLRRC
jgi:RecA-family ATPase